MRLPILGSMLVLAACASGGSGGGATATAAAPQMQQRDQYTRVETAGGTIEIHWAEQRTYEDTKLIVPVERAWAAIPAVFGELGIDPNIVDSKQHVFGNAGATYRNSLGRQRMSHYFSCGSQAGMDNADTYDIFARILSQIVPGDGGLSTLRTQVEATAHATGNSGQAIRCSSTGALEARIANMLGQMAARSGS